MSLPGLKNPPVDYEKYLSPLDDKVASQGEIDSANDSDNNLGVLSSERDIATHVISVHDDPTLNPWTLRAFIVGLGLSTFGGVIGKPFILFVSLTPEMFEQRRFITSNPYVLALLLACQLVLISCQQQTIAVSTLFLAIIAYVLGMTLDTVIPRHGFFRYLNPVSFKGFN